MTMVRYKISNYYNFAFMYLLNKLFYIIPSSKMIIDIFCKYTFFLLSIVLLTNKINARKINENKKDINFYSNKYCARTAYRGF